MQNTGLAPNLNEILNDFKLILIYQEVSFACQAPRKAYYAGFEENCSRSDEQG